MDSIVTIVRYGFSLLYGTALTGVLAGVFKDEHGHIVKRNCVIISATMLFTGGVQILLYLTMGKDFTIKTYPIHTHLVLFLVLVFLCKCTTIIAVLAIMMGYMALQIPNWLCEWVCVSYDDPHGLVRCITYAILTVICMRVIYKHFADSVREMMRGSLLAATSFLVLPVVYYVFDYLTTVWTSLLYDGAFLAVQFMPAMICTAHMIFSQAFSVELQKRYVAMREKIMLEGQMKTAEAEFETLRQMQQATRIYRHDMRHHFSLIQSMAAQGRLEDIKSYLAENVAGLNAITPRRFCAMETLNLVLSHFADRADGQKTKYQFEVDLPEKLPLGNTELCSMVSNAIENALNALEDMPEENRSVRLRLCESNGKILFLVENPCREGIVFDGGVPVNTAEGHGFGTKSIVAIAKAHGGDALFTAENGLFRVRVILPMGVEEDANSDM